MRLKITLKGDGVKRLHEAVKVLGETKARKAYSRAINEAAKPSNNQAIKAVAKQMGVTQAVVKKRAGIRSSFASADKLSHTMTVEGGHLLMKDFKPSQSGKGVRAGPWGRRILFRGAFIQSSKLGGNVFHRTTDERLPIKNMYGPAVPKEIVKDHTGEQWQRDSAARLDKRIAHHIKQMTKGVLS